MQHDEAKMKSPGLWISVLMVVVMSIFSGVSTGFGDDTIGAVEDVVLLPWNIKLPARIDTGAATTSLDARSLIIREGIAEFTLPEKYSGQALRLPVKGMRQVRSSSGKQQRPIVELVICIGRHEMRIEANLTNRSRMEFPLLIGRNVLEKGFIVDVREIRKQPPNCLESAKP